MSNIRRFLRRRPKVVLAAGIATVAVATALAAAAIAAPSTGGLVQCGTSNPANLVADFDVPDGPSVFQHLPLLAETPELTDPKGPLNKGPLHVSVFAGDVCGVPVYPPLLASGAPSPTFHNVVRITRADGDAWYLSDVDLSKLVP